MNEDFYKNNTQRDTYEAKQVVGDEAEIMSRLEKPTFLSLSLFFDHPVVCLKANPDEKEFIEVTIEKIVLTSQRKLDPNRVKYFKETSESLKYKIWSDSYHIVADHFCINLKRNDEKVELEVQAQLNIKIEKLLMHDELKFIFKENIGNFLKFYFPLGTYMDY